MTVREHEIQARQFDFDEKRRKLRDLSDLKQHIEASLDRLVSGPAGSYGNNGSIDERRETLRKSLADIDRQFDETQAALDSARSVLEDSEHVRDGYDRVPVVVGKGRGRGQVEHIRIVRSQRG